METGITLMVVYWDLFILAVQMTLLRIVNLRKFTYALDILLSHQLVYIYHCDIEAIAVHDDEVQTVTEETVFVGLYLLSEGMNLNKYYLKAYSFYHF